MLLDDIIKQFPVTNPRAELAISGYIPIELFNAIEGQIRPEMRKRGMRVWYKGPRPKRVYRPACTRRENATHAMIYPDPDKG